jgi:hypothetical protein
MIAKYDLDFDFFTVATVEIDPEMAAPHIKQMVEFWMGWEEDLEESEGDYTHRFLVNLTRFILNWRRPPEDDEGWVILDGRYGITITSWDRWEPNIDAIDIQQRN